MCLVEIEKAPKVLCMFCKKYSFCFVLVLYNLKHSNYCNSAASSRFFLFPTFKLISMLYVHQGQVILGCCDCLFLDL